MIFYWSYILVNAIFNTYKSFNLQKRSNKITKLNPGINAKTLFKRVEDGDKNNLFKDPSGNFFEHLSTMYDLYQKRIGHENLTYAQFVIHYEKSSEVDSSEFVLSQTDEENKILLIKDSYDDEYLPTQIDTEDGNSVVLHKKETDIYYKGIQFYL